jgi:hypothetical protein
MALQVVSPAVSVYRVTGVKDGSEQSTEHTFRRGELLPDWVSSHQQFVLMSTGMARQVGDFPDPALQRAEEVPAPVVLPEHNPLVVQGTGVTAPMEVTRRYEAATGQADAGDGGLPADADNKPTWERAALDYGITKAEAEAMRKADLVREVKARHDARERARAEAEQDPAGDETVTSPTATGSLSEPTDKK